MGRNGERFVTVGNDSLIQIHSLPEVICESVISLPEQMERIGQCRLNHEENYLAVS